MSKRIGQVQEKKMHMALAVTELFISKIIEEDYEINAQEFIALYFQRPEGIQFYTLLRDFIVACFADSRKCKNGNRIKVYNTHYPEYNQDLVEVHVPNYDMPDEIKDIMKYGSFHNRKKPLKA